MSSDETFVEHHRLVTKIDSDGIAEIRVDLKDVRMVNRIVLGQVGSGVAHQAGSRPQATIDNRTVAGPAIQKVRLESGASAYMLEIGQPERFDHIAWWYSTANMFALDAEDAHVGRPSGQRSLDLDSDEDAIAHIVSFPTGMLELDLEFPDRSSEIINPVIVAEALADPVTFSWVHDPVEAGRALIVQRTPRHVSLAISNPRLHHRYGIKYELAARRKVLGSDVRSFVERTLRVCRESINQDLRNLLVDQIDRAFGAVFGPEERPSSWIAHLWSDEAAKLLPAFGRFPPAQWGSTFDYGVGIAGHAFRTRRATVYKALGRSQVPERTRLLYKPSEVSDRQFDWIIEVPLLVAENDVAVGVIGISGLSGGMLGPFELRAAALAESLMRDQKSPSARSRISELCQMVSVSFWSTMAQSDEYAAEVIAKHWTASI
jgi:hypothetical protein